MLSFATASGAGAICAGKSKVLGGQKRMLKYFDNPHPSGWCNEVLWPAPSERTGMESIHVSPVCHSEVIGWNAGLAINHHCPSVEWNHPSSSMAKDLHLVSQQASIRWEWLSFENNTKTQSITPRAFSFPSASPSIHCHPIYRRVMTTSFIIF